MPFIRTGHVDIREGLAKCSFILSILTFIAGIVFGFMLLSSIGLTDYLIKMSLTVGSFIFCIVFLVIGIILARWSLGGGSVPLIRLSQIYKGVCIDKIICEADLRFFYEELKCPTCKFADKEALSQQKPWCQAPEIPNIKGLHCSTFQQL